MEQSPVEGVVEDWEDSGEKVWVEFLKIVTDVLQNREHYVQAEIEMFSLDRNFSKLFQKVLQNHEHYVKVEIEMYSLGRILQNCNV